MPSPSIWPYIRPGIFYYVVLFAIEQERSFSYRLPLATDYDILGWRVTIPCYLLLARLLLRLGHPGYLLGRSTAACYVWRGMVICWAMGGSRARPCLCKVNYHCACSLRLLSFDDGVPLIYTVYLYIIYIEMKTGSGDLDVMPQRHVVLFI